MPGFDRTGPRGMGPLTGGGRGYCMTASQQPDAQGYEQAPFSWQAPPYSRAFSNAGSGRGFGMGRGMCRGRRGFWRR